MSATLEAEVERYRKLWTDAVSEHQAWIAAWLKERYRSHAVTLRDGWKPKVSADPARKWPDEVRPDLVSKARALVQPQPAPANTGSTPCWPLVLADARDFFVADGLLVEAVMYARDEYGRAKYGVLVTADNGRDHLADALQEKLDFLVYLRADLAQEVTLPVALMYERGIADVVDLVSEILRRSEQGA